MAGKLAGKVAVVTGGSRGIGRGIVEAYLREGANVMFSGRSQSKGETALQELAAAGYSAERTAFRPGDAAAAADVSALVDSAAQRFGRLDVMVNNAGGITAPAPVAQLRDAAWNNDLQWNLSSAFYGAKHALRHMLPQRSGAIINISSTGGKLGLPGMAGYVAAKHGMLGLTKALAQEVGRSGITANAICPGLVLTDAVRDGGPETAAAMGITYEQLVDEVFKERAATGELNTVEQVAEVALLLAGDAGRGITGAAISMDGGQAPY